MTKRNRTKKTVDQVMTEAQAITEIGPIDHHSQFGSWSKEAPAEEETPSSEALDEIAEAIDLTDPSMPMGEDGNVLIDPEEDITFTNSELGVPLLDEAPEANENPTFDQVVAKLDGEEINEMVVEIAESLDLRAEFERQQAPDAESIHKTLKKVRAAFTASKDAARVLLAVNQDSEFINRSISDGKRYNVYALGKIADLVKGLTEGQLTNAINVACMKSLFAFRAAGLPFTSTLAKAAASDKIRDIDPSVKKHLIRHTVSASTAPTQASSTMQALETLGIVRRTGSRKDSVYTLTDSPAVTKLAEKLGIAA